MLAFYVLDDAGEPRPAADSLEWARWFDAADRRIALTARGGPGGVEVSTFFLGVAHGPSSPAAAAGPGGPPGGGVSSRAPRLWETMVFGGPHDGHQWRSASRAEALDQHARAVRLVWGDS